ncbi:unnamed protein product [Rangifer tarandus platyrhynchus]|uniref:Uncharacterized protein n=2 Tax=Rangifer tarandus platyrhynchus TaxID=3082113 RepID=A0ABN8Z9Q6_RANTA|nr:unnamed protein product [Rangifer tarandus platyrhynchus]
MGNLTEEVSLSSFTISNFPSTEISENSKKTPSILLTLSSGSLLLKLKFVFECALYSMRPIKEPCPKGLGRERGGEPQPSQNSLASHLRVGGHVGSSSPPSFLWLSHLLTWPL